MSRKVRFLLIIVSLATLTKGSFFSVNATTRKIPLIHPPYLSLSSLSSKNKKPEKTYIEVLEEKYKELQKVLNNLKFKEITNEIEKMNNINNIEKNYLKFYDTFKNLLIAKQNYEKNLNEASYLLKTKEINLEYEKNQIEDEEKIFEYIEKIIKIKSIIEYEIEKQNKYIIKNLKDFFKNPETINNISSYLGKIIYEIKFNKESNKTSLINRYEIFKKQIPALLEEILKKIKNKPEEYNIKSEYIKFKYGVFESEEKTFEKTINLYCELFNEYEKKLKPIRESVHFQNNIAAERKKLEEKLKSCSNNMENIIKNYEEAIDNNKSEKINSFEKEFEKLNESIKTDVEDLINYNRNSKINFSNLKQTNEIFNLSNQIKVLEYIFKNLKTKKTFKDCFNQMKNLIEDHKNAIDKNDKGTIFSCEENIENLYKSIKANINKFVSQNIKLPLDYSKQDIINRIHKLIREIDRLKLEYDNLKRKTKINIGKNLKKEVNLKTIEKNSKEINNEKLENILNSNFEKMEELVEKYRNAINYNDEGIIFSYEDTIEKLYKSTNSNINKFVSQDIELHLDISKQDIINRIHELIKKIEDLKSLYDILKKQKENNAISSDEGEELVQDNKKIIVENIEFYTPENYESRKDNDEEMLGYLEYFNMESNN